MKYISWSDITDQLLIASKKGTPILKMGDGHPKVMITAGIHGNELPPQIVSIYLIEELLDTMINGTLYIIPFAVPFATMENNRRFKGIDMNRKAFKGGFISNSII